MLASVLIMSLTEDQAEANETMNCIKAGLTVENLSNHTVKIIELRWLNSAGNLWFTEFVDSGELPAGDEWQVKFCITGRDMDATFVSIKYDVLLDGSARQWSKSHYGKQVHVRLDLEPVEARLDIARRNLQIP